MLLLFVMSKTGEMVRLSINISIYQSIHESVNEIIKFTIISDTVRIHLYYAMHVTIGALLNK